MINQEQLFSCESRTPISHAPVFNPGQNVTVDSYLTTGISGVDVDATVIHAMDNGCYLLAVGDGYLIADEMLIMGDPAVDSNKPIAGEGIVFFGNGRLGIPTLRRLVDVGANIRAVVCTASANRRKRANPIERAAREMGLTVIVADGFSPSFVASLGELGASTGVCVDFKILPSDVLTLFRFGVVNLHASLLPYGRGASPVFDVLRRGDTEAGVSVIILTEGIDTGNVVCNLSVPVMDDDTAGTLGDLLAVNGAVLVEDALRRVWQGDRGVSQSELALPWVQPSYCPRISRADCRINPHLTMSEVCNHVRAVSPSPGAWMWVITHESEAPISVKVADVKPYCRNSRQMEGLVRVRSGELLMQVADGIVSIGSLQLPGGRMMRAADFINGHPALLSIAVALDESDLRAPSPFAVR